VSAEARASAQDTEAAKPCALGAFASPQCGPRIHKLFQYRIEVHVARV
jgi:hypothetical protein